MEQGIDEWVSAALALMWMFGLNLTLTMDIVLSEERAEATSLIIYRSIYIPTLT